MQRAGGPGLHTCPNRSQLVRVVTASKLHAPPVQRPKLAEYWTSVFTAQLAAGTGQSLLVAQPPAAEHRPSRQTSASVHRSTSVAEPPEPSQRYASPSEQNAPNGSHTCGKQAPERQYSSGPQSVRRVEAPRSSHCNTDARFALHVRLPGSHKRGSQLGVADGSQYALSASQSSKVHYPNGSQLSRVSPAHRVVPGVQFASRHSPAWHVALPEQVSVRTSLRPFGAHVSTS